MSVMVFWGVVVLICFSIKVSKQQQSEHIDHVCDGILRRGGAWSLLDQAYLVLPVPHELIMQLFLSIADYSYFRRSCKRILGTMWWKQWVSNILIIANSNVLCPSFESMYCWYCCIEIVTPLLSASSAPNILLKLVVLDFRRHQIHRILRWQRIHWNNSCKFKCIMSFLWTYVLLILLH